MTRKQRLAALALLVLALACLLGWYFRPQPLERLCPGLSLADCQSVQVAYEIYGDDDVKTGDKTLRAGDGAFSAVLDSFESAVFRRTPANFLPRGTWTHMSMPGDVQWRAVFHFDAPVTLPDGSTATGALLTVSDFFGALTISYNGEEIFAAENKEVSAALLAAVR